MSRCVHTEVGNIDPTNPKNILGWCQYFKNCCDYGVKCEFCKKNSKNQKKSYFERVE